MKEKKNAVITFRTEEWIKESLEKIAKTNKWSLAQTVEEISKQYICNPKPNTIIVKSKDLAKIVGDCIRENKEAATELNINLEINEETNETQKKLNVQVIESGGLGCICDFDTINELTEEEILNLP